MLAVNAPQPKRARFACGECAFCAKSPTLRAPHFLHGSLSLVLYADELSSCFLFLRNGYPAFSGMSPTIFASLSFPSCQFFLQINTGFSRAQLLKAIRNFSNDPTITSILSANAPKKTWLYFWAVKNFWVEMNFLLIWTVVYSVLLLFLVFSIDAKSVWKCGSLQIKKNVSKWWCGCYSTITSSKSISVSTFCE